MTPKEIIEALQEHFKDRMDEKIDIEDLGDALFCNVPKDKKHLKVLLEDYDV